jgi:hypothetical protein
MCHASNRTVLGIGLIIAVSFFIVVGWFATNFLGRLFIHTSEYIVDRIKERGQATFQAGIVVDGRGHATWTPAPAGPQCGVANVGFG